MKKISVLFLAGILCLGIFSGCSSSNSAPEPTGSRPTAGSSSSSPKRPPQTPGIAPLTEKEAREYVEHLFETYPFKFLLCSEETFDSIQTDGLNDYYLPFFVDDVSGVERPTIDNLKGKYINAQEAKTLLAWQEGLDYSYNVYSLADLQKSFDTLWGQDSIDVSAWGIGGDSSMFITQSGYILSAMLGYGDTGDHLFWEIDNIELDGNMAVLSLYAVQYNYFDLSAMDYRTGRYLGNDFEELSPDSSFDDVLSEVGITRENLGSFEMIVYKGEEGLWLEAGMSPFSITTIEEFCTIYKGAWYSDSGTLVGFGFREIDGEDIPYFVWAVQDSGVFDGPGEIVKLTKRGEIEYLLTVDFPEIDGAGIYASAATLTVLFIDPDIYDHMILVQHAEEPLMEYTLEDYYSPTHSEGLG